MIISECPCGIHREDCEYHRSTFTICESYEFEEAFLGTPGGDWHLNLGGINLAGLAASTSIPGVYLDIDFSNAPVGLFVNGVKVGLE
jgi:hypothetical protein